MLRNDLQCEIAIAPAIEKPDNREGHFIKKFSTTIKNIMGIAKGAISLLYELKRDHGLPGKSILELGKQDIYIKSSQLKSIQEQFGFFGNEIHTAIDDECFFTEFGFDKVDSIDASAYEGAKIIHDFNLPVNDELHGKYNMVFDGGTIEHVFSLQTCLTNIHNLLDLNGVVVHASPSHNHVDHGFYMFSPTFFYDYYRANGYKILKSYVFEYEPAHDSKDWVIYEYSPGCINKLSFGGWGEKMLGIWFVAQKLESSTCGVIPQQGNYVAAWNKKDTPAQSKTPSTETEKIKHVLKMKMPFLFGAGKAIGRFIRQRRFLPASLRRPWRPKVIARY